MASVWSDGIDDDDCIAKTADGDGTSKSTCTVSTCRMVRGMVDDDDDDDGNNHEKNPFDLLLFPSTAVVREKGKRASRGTT